MAEFRYFTRGDSPVQGKARVYFTAHPDDFDRYLDEIREEILQKQNCALFCLEKDTLPDEVEDLELRLAEMQLFVIPVTRKLLTTPSRAMDIEVPFAAEKHIPVLPIMQEGGLDALFSEKFGDLQYLDRYSSDPTALPFDHKLARYLESVIVGDEIAEKIRAAFDAYVFMSYRKKDRRYAQDLMRLIHSNPLCRDLAIWYDEYLTPGEDFNDAIQAALEKSGLFALAVTPNLVNELNYIFRVEYPMARSMGKEILPFELVPTDRGKLNEMYEGIPEPVAAGDSDAMRDCLTEMIRKIAVTENDRDPQHNFFIGLAYLSGIDMEVDHSRAVELITGSAESGCIEAMKKLASMYYNGDGLQRDIGKAIEWQGRVAAYWAELTEKTRSEEDGIVCLREASELGELAYHAEDYETAAAAFSLCYEGGNTVAFKAMGSGILGKIKSIWNKYAKKSPYYEEAFKIMIKGGRMMMETAFRIGLDEMIREWPQKALALSRTGYMIYRDAQTAVELLSVTGRLITEVTLSGNQAGAENLIGIGNECWERLPEEEKTFEARLAYALFHKGLSIYYESVSDHSSAFLSLEEERKMLNVLSSESPENYMLRLETIGCRLDEAEICISGGDLKAAGAILEQSEQWIDAEEQSANTDLLLSRCMLNKGKIAFLSGRSEEAVRYLKDGHELLTSLVVTMFDAEHLRTLCEMSELAGDACFSLGDYAGAHEWHMDALRQITDAYAFSGLVRDSRPGARLYEKMMDDSMMSGDVWGVSENYNKALWTRETLIRDSGVKGGLRTRTVSELAEKGKLTSAIARRDVDEYERLRNRKEEVNGFISSHPVTEPVLSDTLHDGEADIREVFTALKTLASVCLGKHIAEEIRPYMESLQKELSKADEPADIMKDPSFSSYRFAGLMATIYNRFHGSFIPFIRYDEACVLMMAFCGCMYLYLSVNMKGTEEQRALREMITALLQWRYPVSRIEYSGLWQTLHCFIKETLY